MTLLELLIASSMLLLLAGVIGGLASAVQTSSNYSQGHADAAQHARVALERITREIGKATAVGEYPGLAVMYQEVGGVRYPDTLLVWRPTTTPANPNGPPLISELVIYAPHPQQPEQLLEIRAPQDTRPIPLDESLNQSPWPETIAALKKDAQTQRVVLTNLLRISAASGSKALSLQRPAVRFHYELRPSAAELADYRSGAIAWNALSWPQALYGSQTGIRQAWLRAELQLVPASDGPSEELNQQAIPFLGSAALYYQLRP